MAKTTAQKLQALQVVKCYTIRRHMHFRNFEFVRIPKLRVKLLSVDCLMVGSMEPQDIEDMATREDALFLFMVDAPDLETAGTIIDEMIEDFVY